MRLVETECTADGVLSALDALLGGFGSLGGLLDLLLFSGHNLIDQINILYLIVNIRMESASYESGDGKQTHRIEMLMLAILHVSAWACLIKSDYNFVFIIFAYFYIVSRKDNVSITIIFYIVVLLLLMDLIFYLFVTSSWMTLEENNSVWNGLHGMHGFAIFCSVIITILKIPLAWMLNVLRKSLDTK